MKKSILTALALASTVLTQNSYAGATSTPAIQTAPQGGTSGAYISVDGGALLVNDVDFDYGSIFGIGLDGKFEFDTGFAVNLAAGYRFDSGIALELQAGYYQADYQSNFNANIIDRFASIDGSIEIVPVFTTIKYDIRLTDSVSLELGAGVGAAYGQIDAVGSLLGTAIASSSDDSWELVYQGMAGFNFKLSNNIDLKAGYRFLGMSNFGDDFSDNDLNAHYIGGGLNIRF
jgi:OmpA-OmpF porin, OOP family